MSDISSGTNNSLENAIAGKYEIKIGRIFSEAWDKTKGVKGAYWGGIIYTFLVLLLCSIPIGIIIGILMTVAGVPADQIKHAGDLHLATGPTLGGMLFLYLFSIAMVVLFSPLLAGLKMIFVRRSVDLPIRAKTVFNYYGFIKRLWVVPMIFITLKILFQLLAIILSLFESSVLGGSLLFVLAFGYLCLLIYLGISWMFFSRLVADKNLTVSEAMSASRKATSHHFFKILFLIILAVLYVLFTCLIPFLFIWTIPTTHNVFGILYREMFGVSSVA